MDQDKGELLSEEIYRKLTHLQKELDAPRELPKEPYRASVPIHGNGRNDSGIDPQLILALNGAYQDSMSEDPRGDKESDPIRFNPFFLGKGFKTV